MAHAAYGAAGHVTCHGLSVDGCKDALGVWLGLAEGESGQVTVRGSKMAPPEYEKPAGATKEEGIPSEKVKSKVQKKQQQQQQQGGRRDVPSEHKHEQKKHQQHSGTDGAGKFVRGARQRTREKLDAAVSRGSTMTR